MRSFVTLATLAIVLAGCVSAPTGTLIAPADVKDPFGGFPDPFLMGESHDHADMASHALATPTMDLLAREDFTASGVPYVAIGEMDLLGENHLVVAAILDGFYVVDVSDPASPAVVSFTPNPGFNGDVKASKSGNFVFLGIQLAGFTGIQAWNVAVRERPVLAGAWPIVGVPGETGNGGCHMLAVHGDNLYCSPNDATVRIFRVTETPAAVALEPAGTYAPLDDSVLPVLAAPDHGEEFTHDMTVQDDPLTGTPVMFVSFWELGVRVVDVSDPASPKEIGAWMGEGSDVYDGNVHTTMATMLDGKRVVVTVPEYSSTPSLTVLDATDYTAMTVLGVWAPHAAEEYNDAAQDPSAFSAHNFQLVDGRAYMAMYHGGVWVIDLATATPVGYLLPAEPAPPTPVDAPIFGGGGPNAWDVVLKNGVILASDIPSGLYALHYAEDEIGDATLTSFA